MLMAEQLSSLTKAVAVALDIAGRPDTDDAYALNSVRKAYSLLNGATFQDLVAEPVDTVGSTTFGFDWMDAYRLEAGKADALAEQVRALEAELAKVNVGAASPQARPSEPIGMKPKTERVRERIVAALRDRDCTGQELSRITGIHLRTVQRRLKELIALGMVRQASDDLSPLYTLTITRH
jgi:DNA-binding transcriptional ArsR family regulator